jgi:methylated-DNA-[protein]-cysteine S-methyltransferase
MKLAPDLALMRHPTPLGPVTLAASPLGLAGLWFEDQRHHPTLEGRAWTTEHPLLDAVGRQLDAYFAGEGLGPLPVLDLSGGTPFQQQVWVALLSVPLGHTCSYGDIAARVGRPTAVRAVGAAVGRNPVGIVVPCHRVLGSQGQLTGYAGGLHRKQHLLTLEGTQR